MTMDEAVISLCDLTGNAVRPWAEAGYKCICVDVCHSIRKERVDGNITFVWGDVRSWRLPEGIKPIFVFAWPPCTHVAGSGARDFVKKGGAMLRDALETFEASRMACTWSGAPYLVENSVGILSSLPHIGKPTHYFHPWQYAGYLDDIETENTQKKTCLWTGNGFVMPDMKPAPAPHRQDCWQASNKSGRADLRAATAKGFAQAVFEANKPVSDEEMDDWLNE